MRKPLLLAGTILLLATQTLQISHVDNDIVFEEGPARDVEESLYSRIISRVKRNLFSIFLPGDTATTTAQDTIEEAVSSTEATITSSWRETRSPDEEEMITSAGQPLDDDEDNSFGSGDIDGSGEIPNGVPLEPEDIKPTLYRITLHVLQPWRDEYYSTRSPEYKEFAESLKNDIEKLYENLSGTQSTEVISIQKTDDPFYQKVTVDLRSRSNSDGPAIKRLISNKIEETQRIGSHTIRDKGFTFNTFRDVCNEKEILCPLSNTCIKVELRCDGTPNCPDREDEEGCPPPDYLPKELTTPSSAIDSHTRNFGIDEFEKPETSLPLSTTEAGDVDSNMVDIENGGLKCRGDTVPSPCKDHPDVLICPDKKCDNTLDCPLGDDEENCSTDCLQNEFACDMGRCIPDSNVCDGNPDCQDNKDEHPDRCQSWQCTDFKCSSGKCIPYMKVCDYNNDCPDGDDERNCTSPRVCLADQFLCHDQSECIPKSSVCDSRSNCVDNSDESNCPTTTDCSLNEIKCFNGDCVPASARCNGVDDCVDRSDEEGCSSLIKCLSNQWQCTDGGCIDSSLRCNMQSDCLDDSDEHNCKCPGDWFMCKNGHCIPQEKHCDNQSDCNDMSDETGCENAVKPTIPLCSVAEALCKSGDQCYIAENRCNGKPDCDDNSDESNCCQSDEFQCDDGHCISSMARCNGRPDCRNREDEQNCPGTCHQSQFRCDNGACVPSEGRCNGSPDCEDSSDERGCDDVHDCFENEFRCSNGICINAAFYCDHIPDCTDGSDELNCNKRECKSSDFRCRSDGKCIRDSNVCDGSVDCQDGSDEEQANCRSCHSDQFQCNSGECIPLDRRCDNRRDCRDNSDETNNDCRDQPKPIPPDFGNCSAGEFACWSRDRCIPSYQHCNGKYECADRSDEENCALNPPPEVKIYEGDQIIKETREAVFRCRDEGLGRFRVQWSRERGLPLPPGSRDHNGRLEIPNVQREHSGTYYCEAVGISPSIPGAKVSVHLTVEQLIYPTHGPFPEACKQGEATCNNRECIRKDQVCDGAFDCGDGSDETRCHKINQPCEPNEFHCNNKKCILKSWRCDKEDDCGDGSDELGCDIMKPGSSCHENEFECQSKNQCIPRHFHCDKSNDCQDGSDELGCYPMQIVGDPPPYLDLVEGSTMIITCEAVGVPVPVISWRWNWKNVPSKCTMESINGKGRLTCPDMQQQDSGAYSCEAISTVTYVIGSQDTIVTISGDTIPCFCFGLSTTCRRANLYINQLSPPERIFRLLNVYISPNWIDVRVDEDSSFQPDVRSSYDGFRIHSDSGSRAYESVYSYYILPEPIYTGNLLRSYGGYLSYSIMVDNLDRQLDIPEIIITGNGRTLMYKHPFPIEENSVIMVNASISEGRGWELLKPNQTKYPARREDIMMTLFNVDKILIRIQYTSGQGVMTTFANLTMDSASIAPTNLGKAVFIEECTCPAGYTGLSCEECAIGYSRVASPPWLGYCFISKPCPRGEYGDPSRNIPCEKCPCPRTEPPNQFTEDCKLDTDFNATCNCPPGYTGRRCDMCAPGYVGNPKEYGGSCQRKPQCDPTGSITSYPINGQCQCKAYVTGPNCNECIDGTYYLSQDGCIPCFCMGITENCSKSMLHRDEIIATFGRGNEKVLLAPEDDITNTVEAWVNPGSMELAYDQFQPKVYYWILPTKFLGDQVKSYGGFLKYRLRYVPTPGGQSSRNNAPIIKLFSKNGVNLNYFGNGTTEADRVQEVTVPLKEQYWQREDGKEPARGYFLMALAGLQGIHLKATFTTNTQSAALEYVSLDTARDYYSSKGIAEEVEQCYCPPGYEGTSCEYCSAGYKRDKQGVYLGLCTECDCNNRSNQCHPETGECINCDDYWTGTECEICPDGYRQNSRGRCLPSEQCPCDPKGSVLSTSDKCPCKCKVNVEGEYCDRCRPGTFNLERDNPLGCTECFCSGVSDSCQSSNLYYEPIPMVWLTEGDHGFILSDRNGADIIRDGFILNPSMNEIGHTFYPRQENYYWSLPSKFTGDKVSSYGGNLIFTQRYTSRSGDYPQPNHDVILSGSGKSIYWRNEKLPRPNEKKTFSVVIKEGEWRRTDPHTGHSIAERREILEILSELSSIQIRASLGRDSDTSFLSDVSLDVAISSSSGQQAFAVEHCRCPPSYTGTSCQQCDRHLYKDYDNICKPCNCNGHEESCSLGSNNQLHCNCQSGWTGQYCETVSCPGHHYVDCDNICRRCPCNDREESCYLSQIGQCHNVQCICRHGYHGKYCEQDNGTMIHMTPGGPLFPRIGDLIEFICDFNYPERVYGEIQLVYSPKQATGVSTSLTEAFHHQSHVSKVVRAEPGLQKIVCRLYNSNREVVGLSSAVVTVLGPNKILPGSSLPPTIFLSIIDEEPTIQIKQVGSTVRYTCSVQGSGISSDGQIRLVWSKLGGALPYGRATDDRQGNLRIVDLKVSDSGIYICTAESDINSGSHQVELQVGAVSPRIKHGEEAHVPPSISISPPNVDVREGDAIEVVCYARGTPLPSIEWRRAYNETFNPSVKIVYGTLKIPYASRSDAGRYECIARNDAGYDIKSINVYVSDVQGPYPVTITPAIIRTLPGERVTLNCDVDSSSSYEIEWKRDNNRPVPYSVNKSGNQLQLMRTNSEDSGMYTCVVRSRATGRTIGEATARVTIGRSQPNYPSISPERQELPQGHSAEFLCNVPYDTYSASHSVRWYKAQGEISSTAQYLNDGRILRIPSLTINDRGIYLCNFIFRGRPLNVSAALEVEPREAPTIELYPPDKIQILSVGNNLMLQCRVTGIPIPTLTWSRADNQTLPHNIVPSSGGVLRFNRVNLNDAGDYKCTAVNDAGYRTLIAHIEVQSPPEIRVHPSDTVQLRAGQNLDLTCTAEGTPIPSVRWTKQDPYREASYGVVAGHGFAEANPGRAEYQVLQVSAEDEGIYYCVAHNMAKTEVKYVQVIVDDSREPPSQPRQPSFTPEEDSLWVPAGEDNQIDCTIDTDRNLVRQWVRADRKEFPPGVSQRDGVLFIRAATRETEGEYVCLVLDEQGRVDRRIGKYIYVKSLPVITLEPAKQTVRPGDDAQILCNAHGEQPIEITWRANHTLSSHVHISGGLLSFRGITESDAGRYVCMAKNIVGLREAAAEVIVNENGAFRPRVVVLGDRSRTAPEGTNLDLECRADVPGEVIWTKEPGPMPTNAVMYGSTLRLVRADVHNSGRYACTVLAPNGASGRDYINLAITRENCGFQCRSGHCINKLQRCDNRPDCADWSDERDCLRRRRGAHRGGLKIEPSIDIIGVGSTVDLKCITEGIPSSSIVWSKVSESHLGENVDIMSRNVLRITDVTTNNAGTYRCSARTELGTHTDDYTLNVQVDAPQQTVGDYDDDADDDIDVAKPQPAAKTVSLKLGDSADINCSNDLEQPVKYHWIRQGGLPATAISQEGKLTLKKVTAKDSGLYTCIATNGEVKMEIPTFVVIYGTIPRFTQTSQSYLKLKTLFDALMQFDIEILFKPEQANGLLLFNGKRHPSASGASDFISFGLRDSYPEFKFDVGSGHATIVGRSPLEMGKWVKARLIRNRKEGRLIINDEEPVIGTSPGRHHSLDLDLPLYIGSVPNFNEIPKSVEYSTGFRGCIARLVLKNEEQTLTRAGALEWTGISECDTCAENSCTNSGACQEFPNRRGYLCLCPSGFSGENCNRFGESCYPGLCGEGFCENTDKGYICKCQLGLAGVNCEHSVDVRTPMFQDNAYMAFPTPRSTEKLDITLKLNPMDSRDGLILYAAQSDFGSGNYLSLALKDRRLEFRMETGSGAPIVVKSNAEIIPGSWITVSTGRDAREARLSIGQDVARTTLTSGQRRELILGTNLYLGGFDTSLGSVHPNIGVTNGFTGCISHLEVSRMDLDILKSSKESSNVRECASGNPCRETPCLNGGTCQLEGSNYLCLCTPDFSGRHCDKFKNNCERFQPCRNKGDCIPLSTGYKCNCAKGFSGQNCTMREHFTTSISLSGDGWVELPRNVLAEVGDQTEVEMTVVTTSRDGLLMWHGQEPRTAGGVSDFFSVAASEGNVKVILELGSGLGEVMSNQRIDDGLPHNIRVSRSGNLVVLNVDKDKVEGQSEGLLSKLNAKGNVYVGGLPDIRYMTNGRYLHNFNGCIKNLRIQNSDDINVSNTAVATVNVVKCPVTKWIPTSTKLTFLLTSARPTPPGDWPYQGRSASAILNKISFVVFLLAPLTHIICNSFA